MPILGQLLTPSHERVPTEDIDDSPPPASALASAIAPAVAVTANTTSTTNTTTTLTGTATATATTSTTGSSTYELNHPLVQTVEEEEEEEAYNEQGDIEQGGTTGTRTTTNTNLDAVELFPSTATTIATTSNGSLPRRASSSEQRRSSRRASTSRRSSSSRNNNTNINNNTNTNTITLAELEEERELARRRVSFCVLVAVFVLFRLWIEALTTGDFFLMMLCLFGTSWTARFIRHNREHEEALDERIRQYLEQNQNNTTFNEGEDPNNPSIDRNDLRNLSFQAQLALALMESQRQMQMGGYGNPEGYNGEDGVSEMAKSTWEEFTWKEGMEESGGAIKRSSLTNTSENPNNHNNKNNHLQNHPLYQDEAPHCSICLGEYEEGEKLIKLPCGHIFHTDCIGSWTSNHTRCPLCNLDLESVGAASDDATTATTISSGSNMIV